VLASAKTVFVQLKTATAKTGFWCALLISALRRGHALKMLIVQKMINAMMA
jgi:hypothetical protein